MSTPSFSRPGAIDLSSLGKPARATDGGPAGSSAGGAGGRYTLAITSEASLRNDVIAQSTNAVVLVTFWATESAESVELKNALTRLADEYDGRFLHATLDVGAHAELAQALGVPGVPLVLAALRGQLAPLLQQGLGETELRTVLDQVMQAAVANGVTGRVAPVGEPVGDAAPDEAAADEPPAKHPEAEAALQSGDYAAAIEAFDKAARADPSDEEARIGAIEARLMQRALGVDAASARAAGESRPDDVEAQLVVADLDILDERVDEAFERLLGLVRRLAADDRDAVRQHLVDLFLVVGPSDPRVARARQQLAAALF